MLSEGNGKGSFDGIYERERLRRMARKLGLRLVKSDQRRLQANDGPEVAAQCGYQDTRDEPLTRLTDLDKCG